MVTTQSFRLLGELDTKDIACEQVDEENVVFWEDIEQVFPGVKYIANGNTVINMMRGSDRKRISPPCIRHYPGVVLDVAISPTASNSPLEFTTEIQSVTLLDEQSFASTATLGLEPDIIQRLASALSPEIQTQLQFSSEEYDLITQAIKGGELDSSELVKKCLLELKTEMDKNRTLSDRIMELQEETKRLKQQTPLQTHVDTLLVDTYESYKHPIPRLFVVLPDIASCNSNKFRLYFLCECGEHTRTTSSKVSHHIHFAKHEGYEVIYPKELFRRFRSNILSISNVLKIGISEAGVIMPALISCIIVGDSEITNVSPKVLDMMERMMNQIIDHIESNSADEENNDTTGSVDLTELEPFLKDDRSMALGNLYRITNFNGHVRWICADHYREMHPEKATKAFRDTVVSLDGSFDENLGCVKVVLRSRDQADRFHLALEEAKFIYELKIDLRWDTTRSDFKRLRDALVQTNVCVLELDFNNWDGSASDNNTNRNQYHHPIFDIMRHPTIKSITLVGPPKDFIKKSNLSSFKGDFSNLKHLDVDLTLLGADIPGLKDMIAKAPNLAHLVLSNSIGLVVSVFNAIAEHLTYPVTFPDEQLCISPPTNGPSQPMGDIKDMTALLKALAGRIEIVDLYQAEPESIVAAFAAETQPRLEELTVRRVGRNLGKQCIENLVSIVARSRLRKLDIDLEDEEERVSILKSIRWEHIRDLTIRMDEDSQGMGPLKAIVDKIKMSGSDLDCFGVCYGPPPTTLPIAQEQLLQSIVASTSLVRLQVDVTMTLKQVQSLLDSANVSRLQHLILPCADFKSTEVDTILGKLQQATRLQSVTLLGAVITNEQTDRMKARKVTVRGNNVAPLEPVNTDIHNPAVPSENNAPYHQGMEMGSVDPSSMHGTYIL